MLHRLEDKISDDLTHALTHTIRRWFGDPRSAGLERVTEQEIDIVCQLASSHADRLFRAGWANKGRRTRRMIGASLAVLVGAYWIAIAAHYALDLDGDGQLTIADAHALIDVLFYGTTKHIPIRIKTRDGRHVVATYSYTPDPDSEREIEELSPGG